MAKHVQIECDFCHVMSRKGQAFDVLRVYSRHDGKEILRADLCLDCLGKFHTQLGLLDDDHQPEGVTND